MTAKLDLKKTMKRYWEAPQGAFEIVDIPAFQFAMVDGAGNPNTSPAYVEAIEALYAVSYKLKFASKAAGRDYGVLPLEGLWWADDMSAFIRRDMDSWSWTMMIMQPEWTGQDAFGVAVEQVRAGGRSVPPSLRLETLHEGQCVQTLHVGPYDAEGPILQRLHAEFLPENGLAERGKHHEIYLSDPRRTAPEKLKTILRQPVAPGRAAGQG